MDFRVLIITIGIVGDKTCRCCCETSVHRTGTVSISIAVGICVVGEKRQVVRQAIAVVVEAITKFRSIGVNVGVVIVAIFIRIKTVVVVVVVKIGFCQLKSVRTHFSANQPSGDIVHGWVDSSPYPRKAGLVGGIAVGCPLQGDIRAGAFFKAEKIAVGGDVKRTQTAWKVFVACDQGQGFCGGPGIGGMP